MYILCIQTVYTVYSIDRLFIFSSDIVVFAHRVRNERHFWVKLGGLFVLALLSGPCVSCLSCRRHSRKLTVN